MKHTFAKKALLLGAISIFFSITPIHAMADVAAGAPMDPALQREVQTQAGTFSNWSREALRKKLDDSMKFLDREWNKFIKCLKGEGCTKAQIAVITSTLATILAIITVLTYGVLYKKGMLTGVAGAPGRFVAGVPARVSGYAARAGEFVSPYVEKAGAVVTPAMQRARTRATELREAARRRAAGLPGRVGQYFQTPADVALPPVEGEEGL